MELKLAIAMLYSNTVWWQNVPSEGFLVIHVSLVFQPQEKKNQYLSTFKGTGVSTQGKNYSTARWHLIYRL